LSVNVVPEWCVLPGWRDDVKLRDPAPSIAVGVGHAEQSVACVWGTHRARRYKRPLHIKPEVGKIGEHGVETEREMAPYVLQQDHSRS
jgi:hypothetical protein